MKLLARLALFIGALLIVIGGALGYVAWREITLEGPLKAETVIYVEQGKTISSIATMLEQQDVISDARLFKIYVRAKGTIVRSGEFEIPAKASMVKVAEVLDSGRGFSRSVTVPEGLSSAEIVALLNRTPFLQGELVEVPREGTLHPNTYGYARNDKRSAVLARMVKAQEALIDTLWTNSEGARPDVVKTKDQWLKLASLVEKESSQMEDQRMVASVFVNRLRVGMKMQSDPTVIYGIELDKGAPMGRALWRKDLKYDSPYNTYVYYGLPPTPICNPGEGALRAVLNPADTDDLYFVADGTGGHAFAKTLAEHNRNVAKWRKIQRAR